MQAIGPAMAVTSASGWRMRAAPIPIVPMTWVVP